MRSIKFRAWHKTERKMYPVWGMFHNLVSLSTGNDDMMVIDVGEVELLQFTGLHDKNGNFIYEGYIVRYYEKHLFAVKWSEKHCGYLPFCEHRNDYNLPDAKEGSQHAEIIGNLYESPELLAE